MSKKVFEAMTPHVRSATPGQTLGEAAAMMKEDDVGSVPVVEAGSLVGIVTDRDIVLRSVAVGRDPFSLTVGEVASREIVTVEPEDDLGDALKLMAKHQVRRLPVVEGGRLVGMLAQADVALEASEKHAGEMLEQISQPASRQG